MDQKIDKLEPHVVWDIFNQITEIPRCSGKEQRLQTWVEKWADENKIHFRKDDVGNILLTKKAEPGFEGYPTIVFQVHQDMVCEKLSNSKHDFENDPLKTRIEGDYIVADGTTLGADNGIGVSLAMASLIDTETSRYGNIEVLMTVEEETTFRGATNVKKGFFTGKRMINLDSEEAGVIIVESAGAESTQYDLRGKTAEAATWKALRVEIDGLIGGHSGVDIHLNRANAIKLAAQLLRRLSKHAPIRISRIEGGTVANAIPRSAFCDFLVPDGNTDWIKEDLTHWIDEVRKEYPLEKDLRVDLLDVEPKTAFTEEDTRTILNLIEDVPQGVLSWSKNVVGLVKTSNNLGKITTKDDHVQVYLLSRNSNDPLFEKSRVKLRQIGEKYGASTKQSPPSSGWSIDPKAPFVQFIAEEYKTILGKEPKITGIHGGLECSLFTKLDPELQVVSIGATLVSPHSPQEKLQIKSVPILWDLMKIVIRDISKENN